MSASVMMEAGQVALTVDPDPIETREWRDSFETVVRQSGPDRGLFLLNQLEQQAREQGILATRQAYSSYRNTIPLERQGA